VKIRSSQLTTCRVASDGSNVGLEFLDQSGATVTVELPLDQAEAVIMTLPHLLARAVRRQTGDQDARYVFGLHEWALEGAKDQECLIATLKTTNGFEMLWGRRWARWHHRRLKQLADGGIPCQNSTT
jgi:hypothetical protein